MRIATIACSLLLFSAACATRLLSIDGGSTDGNGADGSPSDGAARDLRAADLAAACPGGCPTGLQCCGGLCVNVANDIQNCGACSVGCGGTHPFCEGGSCTQAEAVCNRQQSCGTGSYCCGSTCCAEGMLCCEVMGPGPTAGPTCVSPTANHGTCPVGCPLCQ